MAEPAKADYDIPEIDISHLVTEDDGPVDNLFSERQQALLADALEASWMPDRPFLTMVTWVCSTRPRSHPTCPTSC
jgi:hypothetical protein